MDHITVGFWVGIIASIAGIVLSVVAIVFTAVVDHRSRRVTDQTIKSLQKIESAVERSSDDTRELIKAAWDKMLGSVERTLPTQTRESDARQIALGLASELRTELGLQGKDAATHAPVSVDRLEKMVNTLQQSVESLLKQRSSGRTSLDVERLVEEVAKLSETAATLILAVQNRHISRKEYGRMLEDEVLGPALLELREVGIIIPVVHHHQDGTEEPCYYYPPGVGRLLRTAQSFLPPPNAEVAAKVRAALRKAGYDSKSPPHGTA